MIYEPDEDSFLLEKQVRKLAKGKVLDMGTGSGILALAAKEKSKDVIAVDINNEAVELARKNGLRAIQSDLFNKVKGKFDTIIFNPPYLPEDELEDKESRAITTGGKHGHELIERFLKEAKNHLNEKGTILILFSSLSGDILSLFKKYKYRSKLLDSKKIFFEKLYIYALNI